MKGVAVCPPFFISDFPERDDSPVQSMLSFSREALNSLNQIGRIGNPPHF